VSQITVYDGTSTVNVDADATGELSESFENLGGSTIIRMLDGTGVKQENWTKWRITLVGRGWVPPGLWDLDYTQQLTLTVQDPNESPSFTKQYTVWGSRPNEEWDINAAQFRWTMICEEV